MSDFMQEWFPGTQRPLIINAPMDSVVNAELAVQVSKAGGLGFLQGGDDFVPSNPRVEALTKQLSQALSLLGEPSKGAPLPIGVGFIMSGLNIAEFKVAFSPILSRFMPIAVWLFAPTSPTAYIELIPWLHDQGAGWGLKVAIQVGNVTAAVNAFQAGADVIVAQGIDAGGHQWAQGAGVISLVPQMIDAIREEAEKSSDDRRVAVWAAGGIADGRGAAACLALGVDGVVVGTRFIAAEESSAKQFQKDAVLSAEDGASSTIKSKIHDHILKDHIWGGTYDARGIITPTYLDSLAGLSINENVQRLAEAEKADNFERSVVWCGTAVGLVKTTQPAKEIVCEIRNSAMKVLQQLKSRYLGV